MRSVFRPTAIGSAAVALLMVLALSACGGGDDDEGSPAGSAPAPAETSAAPSGGVFDPSLVTVGPATCEAVGGELVAISAPVTNAGEVPARMRLGSSVGVISDGEPTNRFGSDVAVRVEPGETAIIHTSISLAQGQQFATPLSCSLDPLADPVVSAVSIDSEDLALELASSVDEVSCSGDDGQCVDEVTCTDPSGGTADCQVALRGPGAGAGGGASRLDYEVVVGEDGAWEKALVASSS